MGKKKKWSLPTRLYSAGSWVFIVPQETPISAEYCSTTPRSTKVTAGDRLREQPGVSSALPILSTKMTLLAVRVSITLVTARRVPQPEGVVCVVSLCRSEVLNLYQDLWRMHYKNMTMHNVSNFRVGWIVYILFICGKHLRRRNSTVYYRVRVHPMAQITQVRDNIFVNNLAFFKLFKTFVWNVNFNVRDELSRIFSRIYAIFH